MARRLWASALLALFVLGCATGPQNPWHIPKGREGRFREARKVCHDLTDKDGGVTNRELFEGCMHRRGWRRSRWTDRIGFSS